MATPTESNEEENSEGNVLEKEISELRLAKNELFELTSPVNELLERIAQRERECVDKLHRLTAEEHDREKYQQTVQRLIESKSELKHVKCENDKLADANKQRKQSLDQAAKYSKIQLHKVSELDSQLKVAEQKLRLARAQSRSEIPDNSTVSELQKLLSETRKQLNETKEELNETRQRLSDVQERLTVAEQVTAATQQRELQESDNSEELQRELTSQHHQPTSDKGEVLVS